MYARSRRGEVREAKKDQQVRREVLSEIGSETVDEQHSGARYRNPNRDQARGDRDRSHRHTDEDRSRESAAPGDDALKAD